MFPFRYHKPTSLDAAKELIDSCDEGKVVSGGMTLLPAMKQRLARPSDLIDLGGIASLRGISLRENEVVIGAMMTHATVAASSDVRKAIPALSKLAGLIGDPHVRHRGTIGGSIANNDPSADYPAAVLGLGATIKTDRRSIAADDFFRGLFETSLQPKEIITQITFPIPQKAAYVKFENPVSRYALVGVFAAQTKSGVRVAVTGAGSCVFRQAAFEKALSGNWSVKAIERLKQDVTNLLSDIHGSAAYRAHLVGVIARRAVAEAGG
jgi:carbon-monoxide dehydrogenase medium subunit